jgi:uncharacterized protein YdeI (BOF family)
MRIAHLALQFRTKLSNEMHWQRFKEGIPMARLFHRIVPALLLVLVLTPLAGADRPDDSWIALSGVVADTDENGFELRHDKGTVRVETQHWGMQTRAALDKGQRVTVYGRLDKDLYERKSIEAESVFVDEKDTVYHASGVDEDVDGYTVTFSYESVHSDGKWLSVTGTVDGIDGERLELATAAGPVTVSLDQLKVRPTLHKGDRVRVRGDLEQAFFENRAIYADRVVVLRR